MDRHSSYIFIWLQLELCAMAVLLTKGGSPPAAGGRPRGIPEDGAQPGRVRGFWCRGCRRRALKPAAKALLPAGPVPSLPRPSRRSRQVAVFLEVAAVASRPPPPPPRAGRVGVQTSGQEVVTRSCLAGWWGLLKLVAPAGERIPSSPTHRCLPARLSHARGCRC
jgi:hypothetical protein